MLMPNLRTAVADLVSDGYACACNVAADDETAGMETAMAAADKSFRARVGDRNKAEDALTLARAIQAVPRRRIDAWYRQLYRVTQ